jgi:hypothetical protein
MVTGLILLVTSGEWLTTQDSVAMPYVMVDVEADGPIPGDYSMLCFGAVIVEPALDRTFYGQCKTDIRQVYCESVGSEWV